LLEFSLSGPIVASTNINLSRLYRNLGNQNRFRGYVTLEVFVALAAIWFFFNERRQVRQHNLNEQATD